MLMKAQCCSLRKQQSRGQRRGSQKELPACLGRRLTLLFQGDPQEEAETEASVLGEEGRVGEGALEVGNDR